MRTSRFAWPMRSTTRHGGGRLRELAERLGRSEAAVRQRASRLRAARLAGDRRAGGSDAGP